MVIILTIEEIETYYTVGLIFMIFTAELMFVAHASKSITTIKFPNVCLFHSSIIL